MFRNVEFFLGAVVIAAVLTLSGYAYYQHRASDRLQEDNQLLSGDAKAAATYAREYKKVVAAETKANEQLDEALEANPEWSEQPVPDDVADLLRAHTDAAEQSD